MAYFFCVFLVTSFIYSLVSGEVPQEPVVTRTGGVLYEKRLIEKYLKEEGGTCPVSGEELSVEDLLPVQGAVTAVAFVFVQRVSP